MQLKENCWRYDTEKGAFFVKYYDDAFIADKVRFIHKKLMKNHFPYIAPITSQKSTPYIVHQWVHGRPANYEKTEDRTKSLEMLKALHETNVLWKDALLPRQDLLKKWEVRFARFKNNEKELLPLMGKDFYTISNMTEQALRKIEASKTSKFTLLHGDVVHHNFLLGDQPAIIDFDLACLGDPADEVILWMHRVLPHVNYDIYALLNEQPYAEITRQKRNYLLYPNELLREWLYLLQVNEAQKEQLLQYVRPFTNQALQMWPVLRKQIDKM
ncbi:aminoglycoside phosphotransferase family protein [Lysinibacillus sp. KU-BSD001]|uniref:phosphotransferase n=1 Tax=Lysinibacillus sp. KU-BSD001 TaxID=3141328 RepID=UPI0036E51A53